MSALTLNDYDYLSDGKRINRELIRNGRQVCMIIIRRTCTIIRSNITRDLVVIGRNGSVILYRDYPYVVTNLYFDCGLLRDLLAPEGRRLYLDGMFIDCIGASLGDLRLYLCDYGVDLLLLNRLAFGRGLMRCKEMRLCIRADIFEY